MLPLQFGSNKRKFRDPVQIPPSTSLGRKEPSKSKPPSQKSFNAITYGAGRRSGNESYKKNPGEEVYASYQSKSYFNNRMLVDPWQPLVEKMAKNGTLVSSLADLSVDISSNEVKTNTLHIKGTEVVNSKSYFIPSMIDDPWRSFKL